MQSWASSPAASSTLLLFLNPAILQL